MKSAQRNFVGLMALALLIAMIPVQQANADVKIRATVKTPHLAVRVNTSPRPGGHVLVQRQPAGRHEAVVIDRQDRRVAKRLAKFTGRDKRDLLQMRLRGYSWSQIGSMLNLRPQVVRAAVNAESWERFQHRGAQVRVVRCGIR